MVATNDLGPAILLTCYIFFFLSSTTVAARLWKRTFKTRNIGKDDWMITVSLVD